MQGQKTIGPRFFFHKCLKINRIYTFIKKCPLIYLKIRVTYSKAIGKSELYRGIARAAHRNLLPFIFHRGR